MTPEEMKDLFGGGDLFSDFFQTFFSGAEAGPPPRPRPGRNLEQPVTLTLEEAFAGTTRRIAISGGASSRTVEVRIPAGVRDGARVRASGEGAASDTGGPAGDLYLSVRIGPHDVFERRGDDLHARIAVPLTTAVLGGEATAPVLSGQAPRLKVPELTRPGRVFRLRGHGMPVLGGSGSRGDLYVALDLAMPTRLSPEARTHFEALKALDDEETS
jgi:DnaJ-class molecular chaperone